MSAARLGGPVLARLDLFQVKKKTNSCGACLSAGGKTVSLAKRHQHQSLHSDKEIRLKGAVEYEGRWNWLNYGCRLYSVVTPQTLQAS